MPGNSIFIGYRPNDAAGMSGRLCNRLAGQFGQDQVLDIDTIGRGHESDTDIGGALNACGTRIASIGRERLRISDASGHRWLDNPTDSKSQQRSGGVHSLPVKVDRASTTAPTLSVDILPLSGHQAIESRRTAGTTTRVAGSNSLWKRARPQVAATRAAAAARRRGTTLTQAPSTVAEASGIDRWGARPHNRRGGLVHDFPLAVSAWLAEIWGRHG